MELVIITEFVDPVSVEKHCKDDKAANMIKCVGEEGKLRSG